VMMDEQRTHQILSALVINALKGSQPGEVVRLVVTQQESESRKHRSFDVVVSIRGNKLSEED
jgi:C4-dicarboxylate-specific signal transduction histidine kinase